MRILAVNAGSSSPKLSVVDGNDRIEDEQQTDGDADPIAALRAFVARVGDVDAVAHRLVHGGAAIRRATLVDDEVRRRLDAAIELGPLHFPRSPGPRWCASTPRSTRTSPISLPRTRCRRIGARGGSAGTASTDSRTRGRAG